MGAAQQPAAWLTTLQNEPKKDEAVAQQQQAARGGGGDSDEEEEDSEQNASGLPSGDYDDESEDARKRKKAEEAEAEELAKFATILPRWQTRLFCVECVRRLLAILEEPEHFSLTLAQAAPSKDLLVHSLRELVRASPDPPNLASSPFPISHRV